MNLARLKHGHIQRLDRVWRYVRDHFCHSRNIQTRCALDNRQLKPDFCDLDQAAENMNKNNYDDRGVG